MSDGFRPKFSYGVANGDSVWILAIQEFFIERADQCAAADEGQTEADSFLFGKADDLDGEGKAAAFQAIRARATAMTTPRTPS